jgi:hypothetical protein
MQGWRHEFDSLAVRLQHSIALLAATPLYPPLTIPLQHPGKDHGGGVMDFERHIARKRVTLDEIRIRVGYALQRHPLCRRVQFEIVSMPRSARGSNWTVNLNSVEPRALWEAHDIVSDMQEAYELELT